MHSNKYSLISFSLIFLLLIGSFSAIYGQEDSPKIPSILFPKPEGLYYITAPNGLNLRKKEQADSDKLGKISFGDKVDIITPAKSKSVEVDQIKGGMAKVDFDGVIGYAFEGYLSQFPP
ncbi:MAG: SH3 domain-containing protein, partial [Bacteroidetes bacterium]|nr:SH3 domain-containing protein [Bacteroidota bacterium]